MWARLDDALLPEPGEVARVKVQGVGLALVRHEGCWYALEDRCPHAGAMLSGGSVVDGRLGCPWHGREYALASGACEGYVGVASFAVDERSDGVYVQTEPRATVPAGNDDPP